MHGLASRRVKVFAPAGCLTLATPVVALAAPCTQPAAAITWARISPGIPDRGHSPAPAQAAAEFSVFAEPAAAGDALPADSAYTGGGTARRIAGSTRPFSAWGVLRGSQLCVTVDARSGPAAGGPAACSSPAHQPGQLLVLAAGTGTGTTTQILAGLIPDGVFSVTVSYTNGSTAVPPVTGNGFALNTGGWIPRSLRLDNGCRDRPQRPGSNTNMKHRRRRHRRQAARPSPASSASPP